MTETNETSAVDFGPLAGLIGTWKGDKGLDVAPEREGPEENPYHETIVFEGVGEVENAESQVLVSVRYVEVVRRKSDGEVFHDQTGYWIWDAATGVVVHSFTIPRAVGVLAAGKCTQTGDDVRFDVAAKDGDADWGITQSPFMREQARTLEFRQELTLTGDRLSYQQTTMVDIYGKTFEHTDRNELTRA